MPIYEPGINIKKTTEAVVPKEFIAELLSIKEGKNSAKAIIIQMPNMLSKLTFLRFFGTRQL
jgi:hypothetical protein